MKIVFFGTPDFAVASLSAIMASSHQVAAVVTVPDRQAGRGQHTTASAVKQYAGAHGLPVMQPERLRDATFLAKLEAIGADAFVVVAFRMLPKEVWAMPPRGTFNLHASLLPQYRGAAPINRAIMNGETQTGVTTFLLNERIDEGSILLQRATPIAATDNAGILHDRLAEMGRNLVVETLDALQRGTIAPQPQGPQTDLKPAPKIFKDDCRTPWTATTKVVIDHIRGLAPYPAATMRLEAEDGRVADFKLFEATPAVGPETAPGTVVSDGKTELKIATADSFVSILSLQMSGKKRMTTAEFLRGFDIKLWKTAK